MAKAENERFSISFRSAITGAVSFFSSNRLFCLGLLFSLAAGLAYDLSLLFQNKTVTGIDGYFYVLQTRTFLSDQTFYFPTKTPLILFLLAALGYFTSDIAFAIKLTGIILQTFLSFGVLYLIISITKDRWLGLMGFFLTFFCALHLYFVVEFLNNLGALAFLIWAAVGIIKFSGAKNKRWLVFSLLMTALAMLSHRSIIYLLIAGGFIFLLIYYLFYKPNSKLRYFAIGAIFLTIALPALLEWQPFVAIPEMLAREIEKYPQQPFKILTLMESQVMLFVVVFFVALLFFRPEVLKKSVAGAVLTGILLWTVFVPLNPFLNHQTGFKGIVGRLDALLFLQVSIALPLLIFLLKQLKKTYFLWALLIFVPLLGLRYLSPLPVGVNQRYLERRERIIRLLLNNQPQLCENPLILAQHGEEFLVTATINVPSQQNFPTENKYRCVYWLVHQPTGTNYLQSDRSAGDEILLMEDARFREEMSKLNIKELFELGRINTHLNPVVKNVLDSRKN